jgi:FAD/FMN-containing dehydrogenase
MIATITQIKSGGHAANAGFSSTPGVQIAMYSFSDVVYDSATQTATVGTGLLWDDVYVALEKYSVTVVGAKVTGIGIGGIALGGGMILPRPTTEMNLILFVH